MNSSFPPFSKKAKRSPCGRNNLPSFQICYILNNNNLISFISKTSKVSMKLSSLTKSNVCGYYLHFLFAVKRYPTPQVFLLMKAVRLGIMLSKKILCDSSLIRFHKKCLEEKCAFSYFSCQEEFLSVTKVTKDSEEIRIMFTHYSASKQA